VRDDTLLLGVRVQTERVDLLEGSQARGGLKALVSVTIRFLTIYFAFLTLIVSWMLSAPPGATQAEKSHLLAIWCGDGAATEECRISPSDPSQFQLQGGWDEDPCFAEPSDNAECISNRDWNSISDLSVESIPQSKSAFIELLRPLVDSDSLRSVLRIRLIMASVAAFLLAMTVFLARLNGFFLTQVWVLFATPLALFNISLVQPAAWYLMGTPAAVVSSFIIFKNDHNRYTRFSAHVLLTLASITIVLGGSFGFILALLAVATAFVVAKAQLIQRANVRRCESTSGAQVSKGRRIQQFVAGGVLLLGILLSVAHTRTSNLLISGLESVSLLTENLLRLPILILGLSGGGGWSIGLGLSSMPLLATVVSVVVFSLIIREWLQDASVIHVRQIVSGVVVVLLAVAIFETLENQWLGSDVDVLPRVSAVVSIGLVLMVMTHQTRLSTSRTRFNTCAALFVSALTYWHTLRKYVAGLRELSDPLSNCYLCTLQPKEWWWSIWFERVLSPEITWAISLIAIVTLFQSVHSRGVSLVTAGSGISKSSIVAFAISVAIASVLIFPLLPA
jgi:hypothetical protein